ncbi:RNA polymerase subunit sigma-28 [Paraburkholderia rhizosphaerae]|uniref:DNA-directed RNA polymerase specialized sigma24 family protein n=1 Tax=Paraburkholderia rhizosphaerae TaxID=480658 RepID=A0A4R8LP93_9BURK|nr:RNA polymerase subunit sigma-28 [Paraburkholderia rhizosphaerae]TDY48128.1 DNA-directed RNA polymerase specialized sigma24 family protein [Paraburkholderia rhizosphaerae]
MKTAISYRNIEKLARPELEDLIGRLTERRLKPHLSRFPAEVARLRANLEKSRHRGLYRVRLQLVLPAAMLACGNDSPEPEKAIELSVTELERQLERHVAHLRHEDAWRRKERRAGLRQLKAALAEQTDGGSALFGEIVRPLLASFKRFVQRELAYLRARGDLAAGDPSVDDIVDEALARACERMAERPRRLEPLQWLYQIVLELLAEEVTHRQIEEGRCISLEGRLPVQLREPHEDDDELLFEYWQPDEVLRVEDVVPATDSTPEEAVINRELRELVATLLAELPEPWRRAVTLCRLEGQPAAAAARVLAITERELEDWLAHADAFLKARLGDLRLTPEPSVEPAGYIVPGTLPLAPGLSREFDEATRRDVP